MKVIAVANTKGGVGKTTLASCVGVYLAAMGKRCALVDLDPQCDLSLWGGRRAQSKADPAIDVMRGVEGVDEAIDRLRDQGLDFVVIDTPPGYLEAIEAAIGAADLVLVPLKGGAFDMVSKATAMQSIAQLGKPHLCVVNESPPNWSVTIAARKALLAEGTNLAATTIATRVCYRTAPATGLTGPELKSGTEAEAEIRALVEEILAILTPKRTKGGQK